MEFEEFSLLQRAPGLPELLLKDSWKKSFPARTLSRAIEYTSPTRLLSSHVFENPPDELIVDAEFEDEHGEIDETSIVIDYHDDWPAGFSIFPECSCSAEPHGESGHALLSACLQTGRLFYIPKRDEHISIRSGPSIEVTPSWKSEPDGSATPSLNLLPGTTLIPTSPLCALAPPLDHPYATLHPVTSASHPEPFVITWLRGPTVPAPSVPQLAERLGTLSIPTPAPPSIERKTLAKVRPHPRLTLHRKNPFFHRGLHLSGHPDPIIAELTFLYHGHPAPAISAGSGKLPNFNLAQGQTLLSIPRHKTGEAELTKTLCTTLAVAPASHLDPVPPENLSCFLPAAPPRDWDLEWARIISSRLPELEEQGWEITVDTSAHIELHPLGPDNLDTGLTELPDHGLDWFQFDASYLTPAGEKQSLLPLLCAYLQTIDPESLGDSLATLPEDDLTILKDPASGRFVTINSRRLLTLVKSIYDLFGFSSPDQALHRIQAADLADSLDLDHSETLRALAALGRNLKSVKALPKPRLPKNLTATLRDYQLDGFHWMQFLARHSLHGILADDMGLGKTLQALTHLQSEVSGRRTSKRPSLVVAPTSVVGNWASEARKFAPFQNGEVPIFLISLKAGGTGLNLTAADTVIHYDPWWNPAAENQATDRAHRIGQDKPVFVHKLIAKDTIEERIQSLQAKKAALVEALLTDDTNRLKMDQGTLNNLLAPLV